MAFKDLREFIDELEKRNWLKRIKVPVDAELEISAAAQTAFFALKK